MTFFERLTRETQSKMIKDDSHREAYAVQPLTFERDRISRFLHLHSRPHCRAAVSIVPTGTF